MKPEPTVPKFKVKIKDATTHTELGYLGFRKGSDGRFWGWIVPEAEAETFSHATEGKWQTANGYLSVSATSGTQGWVGLWVKESDGATWTIDATSKKLSYAWGNWTPENLSKHTDSLRACVGTGFSRVEVLAEEVIVGESMAEHHRRDR